MSGCYENRHIWMWHSTSAYTSDPPPDGQRCSCGEFSRAEASSVQAASIAAEQRVAELEAERSKWHECNMGAVRTMDTAARNEDRMEQRVREHADTLASISEILATDGLTDGQALEAIRQVMKGDEGRW